MKKIIVPVDFSSASSNAAEFAGNLAIFYGADLWLYHTYEIPVGVGESAWPLFNVSEMQKAAEEELDILKKSIQDKLRSKIVINTKAEMVLFEDGLKDFCDAVLPDLVVMGLSGKDALTKLIVGSNTIRVIHQLKFPVLVVPPKANFTPVHRIGFACDYRQIAETTPVDLLQKVVTDFNAELHILNVDYQDKNFTPDTVNESFTVRDLFKDIKPVYDSIESENVTEGLNDYAAKKGLDWIVMIPKKHTLLQKIFSRSHAKDMLYHTHLPVLCVHQ